MFFLNGERPFVVADGEVVLPFCMVNVSKQTDCAGKAGGVRAQVAFLNRLDLLQFLFCAIVGAKLDVYDGPVGHHKGTQGFRLFAQLQSFCIALEGFSILALCRLESSKSVVVGGVARLLGQPLVDGISLFGMFAGRLVVALVILQGGEVLVGLRHFEVLRVELFLIYSPSAIEVFAGKFGILQAVVAHPQVVVRHSDHPVLGTVMLLVDSQGLFVKPGGFKKLLYFVQGGAKLRVNVCGVGVLFAQPRPADVQRLPEVPNRVFVPPHVAVNRRDLEVAGLQGGMVWVEVFSPDMQGLAGMFESFRESACL